MIQYKFLSNILVAADILAGRALEVVFLAAAVSLAMFAQTMTIGLGLLLVFEVYLQKIDSPLWPAFNRLNPFGNLSEPLKVYGGASCVLAGLMAHLLLRFYGNSVPGG
jgi:hypothetical protein